jgi:2,4-dienoyl-CoA reductase-like NADH-dependent reductase (Old Yellow Enzyme family)
VIDCSSGGLFGSAAAARGKRTWDSRSHSPSACAGRPVSCPWPLIFIVEPQFAEDILQQGRADLIAIGREAIVNPCWPQLAELALGRKPVEAMDEWSVEYGGWLKHHEWAIERMRADGVANSGEN